VSRSPSQHRALQETDATDERARALKFNTLDEPPEFAEKDYRISATDAKGRTERVWVRLPPYLVRLVQTIVSKGPYPWDTPSDAYRFAIYWGLRLLKHNPPETVTVFAQVQGMNDILTREQDHIAFRAVFDRARDVLNEYQRENAIDEARRVISELDARINQMPMGYWRSKYAKTLRGQFGPLMRGEKMYLASGAQKLAAVSGRPEEEPHNDPDDHITTEGEE
jgi:hypothetical protein